MPLALSFLQEPLPAATRARGYAWGVTVLFRATIFHTTASPFRNDRHALIGAEFGGVVRRTIRRGETIFDDGKIVAKTMGKFVRLGG